MAKRATAPAVIQAACDRCRCETRHKVLHTNKQTGADKNGAWRIVDQMIRCAGCHTVSLRRTEYFSEFTGPDGRPEPMVKYFPAPTPRHRPSWVDELPDELEGLMGEIYEARRGPSVRLIAMGVRAVIDFLMRAEIGDEGGFEEKLKRLLDKGLISEKQHETLATVVDAGSAAGHRAFKPSVALIDGMLDAIESLLQQHYIVGPMVATLKLSIPPRPPQPPRSKK
ncbi:MAG: hypothetical protein GEV13_13790 [Rhodospirillales bacterium]|nr:hypothetical protein [Rhodospirillales bacterium]